MNDPSPQPYEEGRREPHPLPIETITKSFRVAMHYPEPVTVVDDMPLPVTKALQYLLVQREVLKTELDRARTALADFQSGRDHK